MEGINLKRIAHPKVKLISIFFFFVTLFILLDQEAQGVLLKHVLYPVVKKVVKI